MSTEIMSADNTQNIYSEISVIRADIKHILEKQTEASSDVKEINTMLKDPENGVVVRLRQVERWKEDWKNRNSKALWLVGGGLVTVIGAIVIKLFAL